MTEKENRENPVARLLRALRRAPRGITVIAWGGALFAAFRLAAHEGHGLSVSGYVESRAFQVAPLVSGRLETVLALPQQDVEAGQVLATLSSEGSALALRAAQSELARIEAERARTASTMVSDIAANAAQYRAELRRFTSDQDRANIELLRTRATLNEDESQLERLDIELARLDKLGPELVAPDILEEKRLLRETLATRIQGHRTLVVEQRSLLDEARRRAEEFTAAPRLIPNQEIELAPFDEAIAAQRARIEQLRLADRELVMRAPAAGRVAVVLRRPGEVVSAGESVITLLEREPTEVIAHLPEEFMTRVTPGTEALLYRHGNRTVAFDAVVVRTGAGIEQLPVRADASSAVPRWGLPVHLSCPPGRGILAGEHFTVVFRNSTPSPAAAPPK